MQNSEIWQHVVFGKHFFIMWAIIRVQPHNKMLQGEKVRVFLTSGVTVCPERSPIVPEKGVIEEELLVWLYTTLNTLFFYLYFND